MAPPSEQLTFNGDTDARKFFYVDENIVEKEATPVEKAERVVQHLTEKASISTTTSSFATIPLPPSQGLRRSQGEHYR